MTVAQLRGTARVSYSPPPLPPPPPFFSLNSSFPYSPPRPPFSSLDYEQHSYCNGTKSSSKT